jgi:hypothetical protein
MQLVVHSNGTAHCLYNETIDLATIGHLTIQRGSHVEPNSAGEWFCDLSPVSGPQLGPFSARSEALRAEEAWLHEYWLTQQR